MTQTLGEEIIAWIEATCRVPEGALVGQPIRLTEWQKDDPQDLRQFARRACCSST